MLIVVVFFVSFSFQASCLFMKKALVLNASVDIVKTSILVFIELDFGVFDILSIFDL